MISEPELQSLVPLVAAFARQLGDQPASGELETFLRGLLFEPRGLLQSVAGGKATRAEVAAAIASRTHDWLRERPHFRPAAPEDAENFVKVLEGALAPDSLDPAALAAKNLSEGLNCLAIFVCDSARKITLDDDVRSAILQEGIVKLSSIGPQVRERFPTVPATVAALDAFSQRRKDWKPESLAELERLASACLVPLFSQLWGNAHPKSGRCAVHGDQCPDVLPASMPRG